MRRIAHTGLRALPAIALSGIALMATTPLKDTPTILAGNLEYIGINAPVWLETVTANWIVGIGSLAGLAAYLGALWWTSPKRAALSFSPPADMPLSYVLRYLGHGSRWSTAAFVLGWAEWHKDAERELRRHLHNGSLVAQGVWQPNFKEAEKGHRTIEAGEWPYIVLESRLMIERGNTYNFAEKLTDNMQIRYGRYLRLMVHSDRVREIWPPWSLAERLFRAIAPSRRLSFAERTGEVRAWRKGNDHLPKKLEYYWRERPF